LGSEVRPKSGGFQVVVDEDMIQSIETPGLDGQHCGAHALLDDGHRLHAQQVEEWSTSAKHASDG